MNPNDTAAAAIQTQLGRAIINRGICLSCMY